MTREFLGRDEYRRQLEAMSFEELSRAAASAMLCHRKLCGAVDDLLNFGVCVDFSPAHIKDDLFSKAMDVRERSDLINQPEPSFDECRSLLREFAEIESKVEGWRGYFRRKAVMLEDVARLRLSDLIPPEFDENSVECQTAGRSLAGSKQDTLSAVPLSAAQPPEAK